MPIGGVHHEEAGVRVGEGKRREELDPPSRRQLLGPQPRDVFEPVEPEPGCTACGTAVAARHQGQILGDEVADAQVLFGFVDARGVDHAAGLPEVLDPGTSVPAHSSGGWLHAPAQGQGQGGALVLADTLDEQEATACGLQRGGRQQVIPPAGHGKLVYAEQSGPFAENDVHSRLTKLTGQFS